MSVRNADTVAVRIVAVEPPFGARDGVLFGPQRGRDVDEFAPACKTMSFDIHIDVRPADGADFAGEYV